MDILDVSDVVLMVVTILIVLLMQPKIDLRRTLGSSSEPDRREEKIQFKKLHADAIIPTRGTPYSAGFDLYALEDTYIVSGTGNVVVPTGIAVQLPSGTYGRIAMRSGLAVKQHLNVSAGVIDRDYTGPIGVIVFSNKIFDIVRIGEAEIKQTPIAHSCVIKKGERFAQLIPERVSYVVNVEEVLEFDLRYVVDHTGYGSTGTH